MKALLIKLTIILSLFIAFTGCNEDDEMKNTRVTAVKNLYEPSDGKSIVLQSSASASLYFEWEPAKAEDSGMVLYELAFDREGGDFSNPVYRMPSDNNGGYSHATVSHKQLNKIAGMMGIESAQTGKMIWTVFSSKGINDVKAEQFRTLEVTRLAGFAEIPIDVFVTGEGSEGGDDLSKAIKMKAIANGEFEIYTKLTANKSYHFTDAKAGTPKTFYTENGLLKEGQGNSIVQKIGVYRIKLDFNVGNSVNTEITNVGLFFCPDNAIMFSLDYTGNGIWKASNKPINFKTESWGKDERYKFTIETLPGEGEPISESWGTKNTTDSRPTSASPASYYYLAHVPMSQWDDKFKFADEIDGSISDVTVILNADGEYTHEIKKVGEQ